MRDHHDVKRAEGNGEMNHVEPVVSKCRVSLDVRYHPPIPRLVFTRVVLRGFPRSGSMRSRCKCRAVSAYTVLSATHTVGHVRFLSGVDPPKYLSRLFLPHTAVTCRSLGGCRPCHLHGVRQQGGGSLAPESVPCTVPISLPARNRNEPIVVHAALATDVRRWTPSSGGSGLRPHRVWHLSRQACAGAACCFVCLFFVLCRISML